MEKGLGIRLRQWFAIAIVVGLFVGFSPFLFVSERTFAQPIIDGDDFNDNIKDSTKWGGDITKGYGKLEEINQRLEYTTDGGWGDVNHPDSSDWPWNELLPANVSWTVEISATNYAAAMGSAWCSFGMNIESTHDPDDELELELASASQSKFLWTEMRDNGSVVDAREVPTSISSTLLGISYNHLERLFTVMYKDGGAWVSIGSYGVGGSGGSIANADWGLVDTDLFTVTVFGFSVDKFVGPQTIFGDNFRVVKLPPPVLSVSTGSVGTTVTIDGWGFGDSRGSVSIGDASTQTGALTGVASAAAAVKPAKAKVNSWSDTSISLTLNKALPPGTYDVIINPKVRPPQPIVMYDAFTVTAPVILSVPDAGAPEQEVTIEGSFFGTKKGKVYLEYTDGAERKQKSCKVTEWSMYDTSKGDSRIRFIVPKLTKTFAGGDCTLRIVNKIGYAETPFRVGLISDRNLKENVAPVDGKEVLTRLAGLPISVWNYKSQSPFIRHIGPMAQDFRSAFNVGESDRFISMVDVSGVALASIQGLYTILQEKDREIMDLRRENEGLKEELRDIGKRLAAIERQIPK